MTDWLDPEAVRKKMDLYELPTGAVSLDGLRRMVAAFEFVKALAAKDLSYDEQDCVSEIARIIVGEEP